MSDDAYASPPGGLPPQSRRSADRAVFTTAYAVIPHEVMRDIVTSRLPGWHGTRAWVLARPLSGFAETFAQLALAVDPGGGSNAPEPDAAAEAVLFVTGGRPTLDLGDGRPHALQTGSYAYLAPGTPWRLHNPGDAPAHLQWIRKRYLPTDGLDAPEAFVTHEREVTPTPMPETDGRWTTATFVSPDDLRHDMHVNLVTFQPGAAIPFAETHVMEHGIYVLEGRGLYYLNGDWLEVAAGDFLWLRAFCPQACHATGTGPFRYLLYKDVNRHPPLTLQPA
jgi:(S)-ureidoglycine aminohydrolase